MSWTIALVWADETARFRFQWGRIQANTDWVLPVVALAAMGTVDILAGAAGAIVPPDAPRDFGRALGQLLADRDAASRLAAQARPTALAWSEDTMAGRMAERYRQLVAGPRRKAPRARATPDVA